MSRAVDTSTLAAARLGLVGVGVLAIIGSAFGLLFGVPNGMVSGFGTWLVISCLVFSIGLLLLLLIWPLDRLAPIGITATTYFGAYLSASAVHAILIPQNRETLLVSLIWFTPLLVLNKILNEARPARILTWMLFAAPLLILGLLSPRILEAFPPALVGVLIVFALAHVTSALMLNILWRYREALISENERSASFRFAAEILENISESFVLVDRAHRLLYLNKAACAGLGVQRTNAEGKSLGEALPLFASPVVVHALEDAWNETGNRHFEAEGAGHWYEVHCTPGPNDMSVYFRDVTERKRADQMLQLEHTVARCLADADDPDTALKTIMRKICESEDWDLGRYFRLQEAAGVMRFEGFWGKECDEVEQMIAASHGISLRPGEGLVGSIWLSEEPLWSADAISDMRVKKAVNSQTLVQRAAFGFPLRSAGKIIGVLSFTSPEIRAPDERLLAAVRVIGGQIGQYLLRKQAESVLRHSEMRFRKLTALSTDWYWELDANLRFVEIFDSVGSRWGAKGAEMLGLTRWELPGANPTEEARSLIDAAVEARLPYRDLGYEVVSPNGSRHYIQSSAEPIFDEAGQFAGYRGVGKDVTEHRRANQILQLEHTIARCLAEADEPSTALKTIMSEICESEDWNMGRYFRLDEAAGVMRFEEFWGRNGAETDQIMAVSRGFSRRIGEGLVGAAWQSGEPIWCPDVKTDARVEKIVSSFSKNIHASFVFPLRSSGKTVGVIAFTSHQNRTPDERLLVAARLIGGQIGQYLLRKQAELVLRDSETRFRKLTALSSDWYWELDANLRFSVVSDSVSTAWGITAAEMLGRTRWELPGARPTEEARSLIDAAVEGHLPYRDLGYEVVSPDGSTHYLQSSAEPMFDEAGQFTGYRGVGRDVTERKRAERLKDEFVSTVSHELRTPLTSVAGALGLLVGNAAGELPAPAVRLLAIVHANCQRLVRLVNDILDIEKLESGKVAYHFKWLDVQPLVEQAIEANCGFAEDYGTRIQLVAAPTNCTVRADADRLVQVVTNLLSNAVKFSAKDDEVTVQIEFARRNCPDIRARPRLRRTGRIQAPDFSEVRAGRRYRYTAKGWNRPRPQHRPANHHPARWGGGFQ